MIRTFSARAVAAARPLLALGMLLIGVLAPQAAMADTRSVYTIPNIPVEERADSTIQAQENAFAAARLIAANTLIEKITLPEDRAAIGGVPVDMELATRLAAAVDIVEESRGGGIYRGKLTVVLNPVQVRNYLKTLSVPFVDEQAPLAVLVLPEGSALAAVMVEDDLNAIAPYRVAVSQQALNDRADFYPLLQAATAQRVIVTRTYAVGTLTRAQLLLWTPDGLVPFAETDVAATPADLAVKIRDTLNTQWKNQAIVRSTEQTLVQATVRYTGIAEWVSLREALAKSTLVSQFRIEALARDGAVVRFAFVGDAERLRSDLLQRGVALESDATGWTLRSASSVVRRPAGTGVEGQPLPANVQ